MEARSVATRLSGLIGLALLAATAHASVEAFSFVSGPYAISGLPDPLDSNITGTFSGAVESDGYIRLGDLKSFQATVRFNNGVYTVSGPLDLGDLMLFSYNTLGSGSTLTVKGSHPGPGVSGMVCLGAPAALDPACATRSTNPIGMFSYFWPVTPAGGSVQVLAYTIVAPTITLIPSPAPEPSTWALMALGFAGLGLASRRRAAAASAGG